MSIIMGVSAGLSALSSVMGGLSQSRMADYNAKMADYNAGLARQEAVLTRQAGDVEKVRREAEGQKIISRQQNLYGASGVDTASGSPLMVMMETAADVERDAVISRYNYEVKASQAESRATLWENQKEMQKWQSGNAMWGGLLGGAMSAFKGAAAIAGPDAFGSDLSKKAFDRGGWQYSL